VRSNDRWVRDTRERVVTSCEVYTFSVLDVYNKLLICTGYIYTLS